MLQSKKISVKNLTLTDSLKMMSWLWKLFLNVHTYQRVVFLKWWLENNNFEELKYLKLIPRN